MTAYRGHLSEDRRWVTECPHTSTPLHSEVKLVGRGFLVLSRDVADDLSIIIAATSEGSPYVRRRPPEVFRGLQR